VNFFKTPLVLFFSMYCCACLSYTDEEYKIEFRKNSYLACYRSMTAGADGLSRAESEKYCACLADSHIRNLNVIELKKFDLNPLAYKDYMAKTIANCLVR